MRRQWSAPSDYIPVFYDGRILVNAHTNWSVARGHEEKMSRFSKPAQLPSFGIRKRKPQLSSPTAIGEATGWLCFLNFTHLLPY